MLGNQTAVLTFLTLVLYYHYGGESRTFTICERLRKARNELGFSQEYVADYLGISRSTMTQIELGNRKITTEELVKFCKLYCLSADYLLDIGTDDKGQQPFLSHMFNDLNENDRQEIINLIAFKRAMTHR